MFAWLFKRNQKRDTGGSNSSDDGLLHTPFIADGGSAPADPKASHHHQSPEPDGDPGTPADSGPSDCGGGHSCGGASCGGGGGD